MNKLQTPYTIRLKVIALLLIGLFTLGFPSYSCPNINLCNEAVDLSLSLSSNKDVIRAGEKVTFSISVYNNGQNDATGISVLSQIPSGLDHINCSSLNATIKDREVSWSNLEVPVNGILTFTYSAFVQDPGSLVTIAEITGIDQMDINSIPGNGADTDGDGMIGSYDNDESYDADDEDDGDDATLQLASNLTSSTETTIETVITKVDIAPNPSSDILNVIITKKSNALVQMTLYTLMGEIVKAPFTLPSNLGSEQKEIIDVSQLQAGKYILKVQIDNESYIKRVVVGN